MRIAPALAAVAAFAFLCADLAASGVGAQSQPPFPPPPPDADSALPPPPVIGPEAEAPAQISAAPEVAKPVAKPRPRTIPPPPPPPEVVRSATAVLQVLDKVTAETLRFEAPVGRRVRYKALVVEVRACETRDLKAPRPKASAYLQVTSRTNAVVRGDEPDEHEVFKGWMFAEAPSLHALQHPVYDLWLIACSAAPPPV